mmetsp:Transcript_95463/g.165823  ORF Transcript_95463/g.165823 Transcript_95463/m.165823 type:complete len:321 (-) Transcript_95463:111-1073(-)
MAPERERDETEANEAPLTTVSASANDKCKDQEADFPFDVPKLLERCAENERVTMPMGVVLRQVLDESEQQWLYEHIWSVASGTKELDDLANATNPEKHTPEDVALASRVPLPVAFWTHPYSRASSIPEPPARLLQWAEDLMQAVMPESGETKVDSMLAQVYFEGGMLGAHYDQDLSWGLGVSLGAMSVFHCLEEEPAQQIIMRSGDIIVGDFGRMLHGIQVLGMSTAPLWWYEVEALDRARCNILFRQALSEDRQRELSQQRADMLYGQSLDTLLSETRLDMGQISLLLRHAAEIPKDRVPPLQDLADRFFPNKENDTKA